ncbi:MAG: sigma 54-interacting transcriptional regulator [Syntrophaceae bacterium]|nr:sigma 54-interacting transcriptional regulator [Syntrophaceae bacterium]
MRIAPFLLTITNDEEGCRGLLLAGDAFVKNYQTDKALECYAKLKNDLLNLESETADDLFIDMAIKTSKISTGKQSAFDVIKILEDAMKRAQRKNDAAAQALLQMHIAKNEWLLNNFDKSLKIFKKGLVLANKCQDEKLLRSALGLRMYFSYWQGRFRDVISNYEEIVSDVEKNPQGGLPLLATVTVGQCYAYVGQITQGLGMLDAIRTTCREKGDLHTLAYATGAINSAIVMIRSVDETLQYVKDTHDEIRRSGNHYIELLYEGFLAYLYYLKGDLARSVEYLENFIRKCSVINIETLHNTYYMLDLCWAMEQGRYPRVMDLSLEQEVKKLIAGQNVFLKGWAYRYKAYLDIRAKRPAKDVMQSLSQSLRWLEESGHDFEIQQTRLELMRQYLMMGDQAEADKIKKRISDVFPQYHDDMIPPELKAILRQRPSSQTYLKEILKFGSDIMTLADQKDILPRIIAAVNQLTGAERGAIFLAEQNDGQLRLKLRASKNLTPEHVAHPGFQSSLEWMEKILREGGRAQTFIRQDLSPTRPQGPLSDEVIRSRICVPITYEDKAVGVLYHDNRLLHSAFSESDVELLMFFASQTAVILNNIMVNEELQACNLKMREEKQYEEQPYYTRRQISGIIGESSAIRQMLYLVEQVAVMDTNVLILGETGVGKDLVANALHYRSARQGKPFIKANCSALTETLINSELFGHEHGAFTGANTRRNGRFELADQGTIFLDEIGDLPLGVQANLLRVIQSHEFERVGGNKTLRSDFRLIAATNHDLQQLVEEKRFRADLYFRLNVFPIRVPPLRERKEDIPLLVHHFVRLYAQKMKKDIKKVPSAEMNKFMQYSWPGNIRELENVVERGVVLSASSVFRVPDLDSKIMQISKSEPAQSLADNERNHILWALEQKNWKIRGAGGVAEFLNIHPSTLAARMKKLQIKRPPKDA